MQQKQFLKDLKKHFSLNIYEVKLWTALLSRGIASAGELSSTSGVPRSRCYDVLESLEKKGFIIMKIGKPIEYIAVEPEVIIERIKKNIRDDANKFVNQIESINESEELKELGLLYTTGIKHVDVSTITKSIVGRANINRFVKELFSNAKSNIIVVSTQHNIERNFKLLSGFSQNFVRKGVKVRVFAPYKGIDNNKNSAFGNITKNTKRLEGVEFIEYTSPTSFISVDDKEILFMIQGGEVVPDYEVAIWLKSSFFVNAVNTLFEESLK